MAVIDAHGTKRELAPGQRRFRIDIYEHDENEEDGWKYKLYVTDNLYNDSDRLPIQAVAHGNSWKEAYACAEDFIKQASETDNCIF